MDDLDADGYDGLLDRLAADAAGRVGERRPDERGASDGDERGEDADPVVDAVWGAVGDVVPELTDHACRRVLEHADHEPDAALVEEVATHRGSDDAERLRARALTALVADVQDRVRD